MRSLSTQRRTSYEAKVSLFSEAMRETTAAAHSASKEASIRGRDGAAAEGERRSSCWAHLGEIRKERERKEERIKEEGEGRK